MVRHIIGSAHDDENRNKHNSNYKQLFGMHTVMHDLSRRADEILSVARNVNAKNVDVQQQINNLVLSDGESDAEVIQARGDFDVLNERFTDIEDKRGDFNFSSNAPQPPKKGAATCGYKLLRKVGDDTLEVIQPANQGYLRYVYQRGSGGAGYGVNYEALRIIRVEHMSNAYVSIRPKMAEEMVLENTYGWSVDFTNSVFQGILDSNHLDLNRHVYTTGGSDMSPFTIPAGATATYPVGNVQGNGKINVAFFIRGSVTQNETVNIKINGETVKTVTLNLAHSQRVVTHEIETSLSGIGANTFKVGVENTSSREVYIVGLNVYNLKDYEGQKVDGYAAHGSTLHDFIDNNGANDYAIKNAETGQNFGSYHGGEKMVSCEVLWRTSMQDRYEYVDFDSLEVNAWCAIKHFSIKQTTNLIDRAYMHGIHNFDTDGTLQMDFSYEVMDGATPIPLMDFWTSLTCTSPEFTELTHPRRITINANSGQHTLFPATDGFVVQETPDGKQQLQIRFNRYNNEFSSFTNPSSISDQTMYKKHYYAPIRNYQDESRPIAPKVLQFSKGLDFNIY